MTAAWAGLAISSTPASRRTAARDAAERACTVETGGRGGEQVAEGLPAS